jgi:hypothetical protein
MSIHISPKVSGSQPDGTNHPYRSYDRVHENWAKSEDRGVLSLREFVVSPEQPLHINCDHLVELLGDAQHDSSDFGRWVFDEAATVLANIPPEASYIDNNYFSHTAKYLFCAACFKPPLRSVLDHPESLGKAAALVDRAVTFCEMSQSLGTVPLIIRGVIASNMRAWGEQGSIDSFYFNPESLRSPKFVRLIEHATKRENAQAAARPVPSSRATVTAPHLINQRFSSAGTPEKFLLWAFAHRVALPVPELVGRLKELVVDHLGEDARRYSFLTERRADDSGSLPQKCPATTPVLDFRKGIYVDVFGTLIHHDGTPNYRLVQVVKDLMHHNPPRAVYLVSDSQDEEIARSLSFLDERPPVIHKDSLCGSELEYLIDNSAPDPQGLHVRHHFLPQQAVEQAAWLVENDTGCFST